MKLLVILSLVAFLCSSDDFFDDIDFYFDPSHNLTWKDSIPDNMPLIKKPFWSEDGLFRRINIAPSNRYDELLIRKDMMQWHQKLSLINLSLMGYQYYIGKKMDDNPMEYKQKYESTHRDLGYTTYTIYMTSAGLSIFSPPALEYDKNLSSMKLHRYLSLIHFTGMSIQPWLGYQASNNPDDYDHYMDMHRKTGEVVLASYVIAFLLTLLPQ
tara:strand:+ start:221 stop:856 length:636 start_codon:yes stop_codon:yes gene_type:complete